MSLDINFDATQVAPATGDYEVIPNNRYLLQVVDGEKKETAEGQGVGVSLRIQVAEGEYQGKSFNQFYNIQHPTPIAQKIGQAEFSALCHATGVLQPRTLAEFNARPFYGDVVVTPPRKGKDGKEYGEGNSIKKYYKADGSDMKGVVGTIAPAAAQPQQPKKAPPSWVGAAKAS